MNLRELFGLKTDPDRPIHYIIGIAVHSHPRAKNRGDLYMKYGPIIFTNKDVENLKLAIETHEMQMPKTSIEQALKIFDVDFLVGSLSSFIMSCRVNSCTVHHFSNSMALDDSFFDNLIDLANKNKKILEYLQEAEIRI
jgi:hypothetical protein